MANSETGASTSNTSRRQYQVFLSFRGLDTRRGFTDVLHQALKDAKIRVFIEDEELQPGERISGNLERAIDSSQLYIPIFSKNYASSHWCLRDLAKMVENTKSREEGEKVILPIFYDVNPDDVKLKTELYSKAISNLVKKMDDQKKKFSLEDVDKWRQALQEVGGIKGWELEKYQSYTKLIDTVVNEVVLNLKKRQRGVTKDLVGMEDQIATVNKLKPDRSGVLLIGIYGMGGIGKTTLAKIIFNQLCPRFGKNCRFLDDVRESEKTKGLVMLQKKLLSDIAHSREVDGIEDINDGTDMIEETICNMKMLIVLDDVDKANQIQKLIGEKPLYPGTIILVTTRDKRVLKVRGFKYTFQEHEMVPLSNEDALKLFSRHVFADDSPPAEYYTISKCIVSYANGLPLLLESIGALLYDQEDIEIWIELLEKLKKTTPEDVLKMLRISYDSLKHNEQQIFLDIACFFIGMDKTNPMYFWKDCGSSPQSAIRVLIDRFMIKFSKDNKFWMHDQFRDLGRYIATQERTRLWDKDDIICELRSPEAKGSIQALCLTSSWDSHQSPITVTSEQIKRFQHMQFLSLHDVTCQGDFTECLFKLKWIILSYPYGYPGGYNRRLEATNLLHLQNVVVVNLSGIDITEDVLESLIKGAGKLKVLTIQYNKSIHGTPTFPEYSKLEKLTTSKFFSLKEIDCSIGKLGQLTDLNFELCVELEKLPEQIGELQELQHLSLRGCDSLSELPNSVLILKKLTELNVSCTRIARLPDFIGRLSSLASIDVSFTSIEKLPNTMSELVCLKTLQMNHCDRIKELPELPGCLTTLQLTSTSLMTVPNLSCLTNLVELALSDGSESMARSDKIETCNLQWIGSLSELRKLYFCFANVCPPTTELGSLSLLEDLTLHGAYVPAFKQLQSKLIVLELYDTRGKKIRLPQLEKENAIASSSSRQSGEHKVLRQIEIEIFKSHGSSESSVHLRKEPGCNELQGPELIDHWRGAFHFPSSLKMLRKFVLLGCPEVQDIEFGYALESLLVFSIGGCTSLKRLGGLSNLKNLMELTLNKCWSLQVVEGIDELKFLHQLRIDQCESMERIVDPVNSNIPDNCSILITRSEGLPDCGHTYDNWKSYRARILQEKRESFDFYS